MGAGRLVSKHLLLESTILKICVACKEVIKKLPNINPLLCSSYTPVALFGHREEWAVGGHLIS